MRKGRAKGVLEISLEHNENDGLQDGRHDRFPCTKEPQVIPWDNAHVFKINHEPFTDEKKAGFEWF